MQQQSQLSDQCVDDLVEVFFLALPAMDGPELAILLNVVLRVVERETRRAAAAERERLLTPGQN